MTSCKPAIKMAMKNGICSKGAPFRIEKMVENTCHDINGADDSDNDSIDSEDGGPEINGFDGQDERLAFKSAYTARDGLGRTHHDLTRKGGKKRGERLRGAFTLGPGEDIEDFL